MIAFAANTNLTTEVLLTRLADYVFNPIIGVLFALALVYFLIGVFKFVANSDSDDGREEGRNHIIWGLVGMFVMVSVFGIMNLIVRTFDLF